MKENKELQEEVEKTLLSLDGIQRATPGPFFFTRLTASLGYSETSYWERIAAIISRPATAFAGIMVVICLNITALVFQRVPDNQGTANQADVSTVEEYMVATNNLYDDENVEP